ncbi:MAG TPA: PKD domain-containing protein [Bryobacteraceae bacterium]|nr:PKD domain-containing protein [Bryobacteraceae bacterium]
MITRLSLRPISALLCASLCICTAAFAQDANNATKKVASSSGEDQYPDLVEIDPFGGISMYGQVNRGLTTHLVDGGVVGLRIAVNPTKYVGLELWADYAQANVQFKSSAGPYPAGLPGAVAGQPIPPYSFGSRNYMFGLNPVFNLRPRGSKVIPYLTVGVMGVQYTPTDKSQSLAAQPVFSQLYGARNLNDNLQVGLNYGGGVKAHLTDHFGLRLDVRGLWTRNPTYGLPNFPNGTNVYIPSRDKLQGLQATLGLVFYLGQSKCPPMPPAPPPPAPLPTPTLSGADGVICPGKPVTIRATMGGGPADKLTYAWTVNGQAQSATGPELTYTPSAGGTFNVQLTVTDTTPPPPPMERPKNISVRCWVQPPAPQPVAPVTASTSFTVTEGQPTISSVSASPTALACAANTTGAHTATLSSSAQGSACGGNLSYKWTVSEGTVSNDSSANATFDSSSLNFEGGAQGQSKTVTATLTVTDQAGKTATQNTSITVTCQPTFVRLDDIIFAKNNSRVNNCGKRVLIDDAASRLQSGDYDLVLVGHRDTDEAANAPAVRGRGRRAAPGRPLDQDRVLNAAAVLSGGTGTCGQVDPTRIKVDYVGTDQTSETRPGQCGTSNTKERKGSETSDADKNRRVEVYLVPHGSTTSLPPAIKNLQPLPDTEVKALGCPK